MESAHTMKTSRLALCAIFTAAFVSNASRAADWPQWRGPARDGHSPETGLIAPWPKEGPKLAWKIADAGSGYSTPSVVGDRVYLLGNEGLENEFVRALNAADGKTIWTAKLGKVGNPNQKPSFPGARSTPTVVGDVLFALGSDGDLACVSTKDGKIRWQKNLRTEFGGKAGVWAYSESPLVDGDTVVCSPGGTDGTIVALNKTTGDVLWKCTIPEAGAAAYSSAIVVTTGGVKQYVQMIDKGLVGIDAKSGKLLWRFAKAVSKYGANIPSPTAAGNIIYCGSAGTGGGAVKLEAKNGGVEAQELYFEAKLPTAIGGSVKVGDYLYGTTAQALLCIEFATGKVKWEDRAIGAASLCAADGKLYLHGENGEVALVDASPEGYREQGRFTPSESPKRSSPMEKAWAYPVVANGRLYLREHGSLWCYTVK